MNLYLLDAFKAVVRDTVLAPLFVGIVAAVLLLERLIPVDRSQKPFSPGFLQDAVWVAPSLFFAGTVVVAYASALRSFYRNYLDFLTLGSLEHLPQLLRAVIAVLAGDFLAWFQHWLKHKVPWFWEFHAVHHSQRQINLFTDFRFHFVEYMISRPIVLLPLMMLSVETPTVAAYALLTTWYTRVYHANLRTDYGFLRYFVVTPQSHRVHHSIQPEHRDRNFGVLFSVWDWIFRTRFPDHTVYPPTGIDDAAFPLEKSRALPRLLRTFFKQLVYPFQSLMRQGRAR